MFATVAAAYRSVFGAENRLVLRTAAWFGVLMLASVAGFFLAGQSGEVIADVIGLVAGLAAYVSLAVAWHRSVLLGETPRSAGEALRFGPREWRFLAITILATLIAAGPVFVVTLGLAGMALTSPGGYFIALSLTAAWALVLSARLALAFPLVAIDASQAPLRQSWQMTQRIWPRLIAALIIAAIPLALATLLIDLIASRMTGLPAVLVIAALLTALSLVQVGVMATLAAHAYLHVRGRLPTRPSV